MIVTAIVLAIILGGALVWLLNRTPADQLATQAPVDQEQALQQSADETLIAQAQQPTPSATPLSPTESGSVQGVSATAPTGPADMALTLAITSLGGGSLLALGLSRLKNFRS